MLRAFSHRVATCCEVLGVVDSNLTIFKLEPTAPNMWQHIATLWPNACNMLRPTMLQYVGFGMLRSFGRGLRRSTLTYFLNYNNTKLCIIQIFSCFPNGTILLRSKAICSKRMCRLIIVNYIMHNYTRTLTLFLVVEHNV